MKRIRVQIGLRLLMLLVALFCVVVAWVTARRNLHRENVRADIYDLERQREIFSRYEHLPWQRQQLRKAEAEIAEKKQEIGEK